jgi:hypothetical protein
MTWEHRKEGRESMCEKDKYCKKKGLCRKKYYYSIFAINKFLMLEHARIHRKSKGLAL